MENSSDRAQARSNPAVFAARLRGPSIIDDLHRAPELIEHLAQQPERPFVLASSRRLSMPVETLELYHPTQAERQRRTPVSLSMLGRFVPAAVAIAPQPTHWKNSRSFLDHDLRDLISVHDIDRFEHFLRAAEAKSALVLDQQGLANECGLSHRTVTRWLTVLDNCFLIVHLRPSDYSLGRRLVRRPKLHFLQSENFESEVVSELFRNAKHAGDSPNLRFWRDSNGFEIPLVIQSDTEPPMAVSISASPNPADTNRLKRWMELAGATRACLIGRSPGTNRTAGILRYGAGQL